MVSELGLEVGYFKYARYEEAMMRIQALQQTGHAIHGFARFNGFSRVSRLLSEAFGPSQALAWRKALEGGVRPRRGWRCEGGRT
jgi:hypothetical protein